MKPDPTRNTRAAKYRAASKTAGGVRVDVQIGPEAAAVLARMRASGLTVREAVEAALKDAERFQWLLDGNGYYMEENGLCGYTNRPEDKAYAVQMIDEAMAESPVNPPAPAAPPASTNEVMK